MKTNIILCESTQVKNDAYLTRHIYGGLAPVPHLSEWYKGDALSCKPLP